ncbi:MAG: SagB family peptide dehydrogenase [Thermoanaerobaculia bacterium]
MSEPRASRLRRATALVAHWDRGALVLENYLVGRQVEVPPALLALLDRLDRWTRRERLAAAFGGVAGGTDVLELFERDGLLVSEGSALDRKERRLERVWRWGLPARLFHFVTRDVPFASLADERRQLHRLARKEPPPPPSVARRGPRLRLPPIASEESPGTLWHALRSRRTRRQMRRAVLPLASFSQVLGWTWGATRVMEDPGVGRYLLKTSPSGGARHPIEVYPVVLRVEGVTPGVYHYDPVRHSLTRLRPGRLSRRVVRLCADQPWVAQAAAVCFMTAHLPRSMWKYHHPHAYRVVQLDAGHLGQTFHLVCTELGLAPFTTAALRDSEVEALLGIDGVAEVPVYAAAFGLPAAAAPRPRARLGG